MYSRETDFRFRGIKQNIMEVKGEDRSCRHCRQVRSNAHNNVWVHEGFGLWSKADFDNAELNKMIDVGTLFEEPRVRRKHCGSDWKPEKGSCIWFSHGNWLWDPFNEHDSQTCSKSNDNEEEDVTARVVQITSPQNKILHISTEQDIREFVAKYGATNEYVCGIVIDWDAVARDWFGVSFAFRKIEDVLPRRKKIEAWEKTFMWHRGFDVESLLIFDLRAFKDTSPQIVNPLSDV